MKLNKNKLLLFVWVFSLTITVSAQKLLEKPYQKWSKDEAMKILTNSPWVHTYQSTEGLAAAARDQISREQADQRLYRDSKAGSSSSSITPPVVIRLHSALPIRQALVRMKQITAGYDKMDENQRTEFDKTSQGFLNCAICKNFYVVTLTKFADSSKQSVDEGVFQRMTFEQLKGNVWLVNEKGEKRDLVQFNPPKNGGDMAVFYFARKDDKGSLFLTPESKNFELVFSNDFLDARNPYTPMLPRKVEFNVSKLIADGNVIF